MYIKKYILRLPLAIVLECNTYQKKKKKIGPFNFNYKTFRLVVCSTSSVVFVLDRFFVQWKTNFAFCILSSEKIEACVRIGFLNDDL